MEKMDKETREKIVEIVTSSDDESANIIMQICDDVKMGQHGIITFIFGNKEYGWGVLGWNDFPIKEFTKFTLKLMDKNQEIQSLLAQHFSSRRKLEEIVIDPFEEIVIDPYKYV